MLELSQIDLDDVANALEDHSEFGSTWWIDARTGEVWLWSDDLSDDLDGYDPDQREDARLIEPTPSSVGYSDMEDFVSLVRDRRAADLLERAITGRGAFRRFKDTLLEFPELRERWFAFHQVRCRRRAIEWLVDARLIDDDAAADALASLDDPPIADGSAADPRVVAEQTAADLRALYGPRLVDVVLYGSQARGDASPESDVDLAVVLDRVDSPWDELRRMDDVLWRHTFESGVTVSATPISADSWRAAERPLVRTAKAQGVRL